MRNREGGGDNLPDYLNQFASSLVAPLSAVRSSPFSMHHGGLGAVLAVPYEPQWVVERFGADDSPVCQRRHENMHFERHQ